MTQQRPLGRRRIFVGLAAGTGVLGAGALDPAAAAKVGVPSLVPARKLRVGDVIVGPDSKVVRLSSVDRLASGRRRVRYTHPRTGVATPFDAQTDRTGYSPRQKFVLLARGVDVSSVRLTRPTSTTPPPAQPQVIDGGTP